MKSLRKLNFGQAKPLMTNFTSIMFIFGGYSIKNVI